MFIQTTADRADFPAGTAVNGRSTADSSGINDPFTVCDALMRERDALIYHRQMLKRKRTELEQSLQKQRSEREVCPALFVFPSAKAVLRATQSNQVRSTASTHGTAHQCVHNSAVLSSWSTSIGRGVGATCMNEYQKSFHAHCLMRTLRLVKEFYLCSANQDAVMHNLTTVHPAPMLRRLELDVPELTKTIVLKISQWEAEGQLDYLVIRLHRITPTIKLLCNLPSLRSVDLSHTTITNKDLSGLQGCSNLVMLDLSYCDGVTDLSPISQIDSLEVVKSYKCSRLVGVGALGRLPRLKELKLSATAVTDDEIRQLGQSHTLVKIDMNFCEALTNVNPLSSIATLEVINILWCTSLTHMSTLGKLPVLKMINLSYTCITDEDVCLLSECRTLVKIDLHSCRALTNVNPLSSIATLEAMDLSYCTSLTHMSTLGKLPALKEVNLRGTKITDEDVRLLSDCHTLVKIDLSYCEALTNVNPLSSIATLEAMDLSHCTSLTYMSTLGKLPALKEVNLSYTCITEEVVCLLSECRTLVKIDLSYCKALTNVNSLSSTVTLEAIHLSDCTSRSYMCALGKLPALKEVKLSANPITDEDVLLLSESCTLVKIDLFYCDALTNVNPLSSIATLEVINLPLCSSLTRVGELGKLPALKELDLHSTCVTDEEMNSLTSLRRKLGLPSININIGHF